MKDKKINAYKYLALGLIFVATFLGGASYARADDVVYSWAKKMGSTLADVGNSVVVDSSGNVYTTGSFTGTVDFDPGAGTSNLVSAGGTDIFISKLDSSGNFVWAKQIGGITADIGRYIALDSSGNVYTTGQFEDIVDFDPGAGTSNLTSVGSSDIFISKLDSSGNFVWVKQIGDTGTDIGRFITVDSSGNVYTTGVFDAGDNPVDFDPGAGIFNLTSAGSQDIFISKLDSSGNFVWAEQMGGTLQDIGNYMVLDSSGNVYTTGTFNGTSDFDPGVGTSNLVSAGGTDIFISKLDSSGTFVWVKQIGGTGADVANSITTDSSSNVYTTGSFTGTVDFDPGAGTSNLVGAGGTDIFVSKLDSSGTFVWVKQIGGTGADVANSITLDSSSNIYTTGSFTGTVDFDPGAGTSNLVGAGSTDIYINKLDSSGTFVWVKQIGGTGGDIGRSIILDSSGNVHTTGQFAGTVDFDPGAGTSNLVSAGSSEIFVSKLIPLVISIPTLTTSSASSITQTTATLNGNITATGGENSTVRGFHYGTTVGYGTTTSTSGSYGTGAYTRDISSLVCNTTYHYQAFATNSAGDGTSSPDATFITSSCNTNPSTPASLGGASYVNGSTSNDNTPTLSFTLSDTDGSDTVKYQIQIDDTANFSSPVVDYTSLLAAQGSTSFTVGQAAGSGTYTVGSNGQTLSDGSYYWRVKAIDNSLAESSYATANSGSVAFVIDATSPTISETTAVLTPSTNTTPSYTFTTNEAGDITYGGSCTSLTTTASIGVNTIAFNTLAFGTHTDCTITVTDGVLNVSNVLAVTSFTITQPTRYTSSGSSPRKIILAPGYPTIPTVTPTDCKPNDNFSSLTGVACPIELPSDFKFLNNLHIGMTHPDVKKLQEYLNERLWILPEYNGPGSKGKETNFFGAITKFALIKLQKSFNITPAVGFFGPITRGVVNNLSN